MCVSQVLPYHIETTRTFPQYNTLRGKSQSNNYLIVILLQGAYQEELEWLRQADIPEQEHNEYKPWVNSTVVTRKPNGTICLWLDPHDLNKAIQCTPYYVKTIDAVLLKVSGVSHFSILNPGVGSGK